MSCIASPYCQSFDAWLLRDRLPNHRWSDASLPFWTRPPPYHQEYLTLAQILQTRSCQCFRRTISPNRTMASAGCSGSLGSSTFSWTFLYGSSWLAAPRTRFPVQASSWLHQPLWCQYSTLVSAYYMRFERTTWVVPFSRGALIGTIAFHFRYIASFCVDSSQLYLLWLAQGFSGL